jgi:HEPN domain-containing protein
VGLPQDIDARRYYRVSVQRLEEAELILSRLGLAHAAVYLAGYSVECILKALVLVRTPLRNRHATLKALKEDKRFGHNLAGLRDGAVARGALPPREIARQLAYVSTWSEQMRYDPTDRRLADAERFVVAARLVFRWADGSI